MMKFILAWSLSLLAVAGPVNAQDLRLPDFGDPSSQYFGFDRERQLGDEILARLRRRGVIVDDVLLNDYLNSLGQRLAVYANESQTGYHYHWIEASTINAFAAPGGFIGIHTGLMLETASESELVGVLAHETAHVSQRHIARAYADAQNFSFPVLAAVLAGAALAATGNGQVGSAAIAGATAFSAQRQVNFTRANEREADRIGYQLVTNAGFDPIGISNFFARLQRDQTALATQIPEFVRTHPLPADRIADAQLRSDDRGAPVRPQGDSGYELAKVRLRVLTTLNSGELIKRFSDDLKRTSGASKRAVRYGLALGLWRNGRYDDAKTHIAMLRNSAPDELAFRLLEAENHSSSGNYARAWDLYEASLRVFPADFRITLSYAKSLIVGGRGERALKLLEPFLKRRPDSLQLFELYAQAAQKAAQPAVTHAALAEYFYLSGDIDQAVAQAELGLNAAGASHYQRAQLQARLKLLEGERRQREQ